MRQYRDLSIIHIVSKGKQILCLNRRPPCFWSTLPCEVWPAALEGVILCPPSPVLTCALRCLCYMDVNEAALFPHVHLQMTKARNQG